MLHFLFIVVVNIKSNRYRDPWMRQLTVFGLRSMDETIDCVWVE